MRESYRFKVSGRVQGVFFRQSTCQTANALGLQGWVRNLADGSVEGRVAGDAACLQKMRQWLQRGPTRAEVKHLEWQESKASELPSPFEVRR